MNFLSLLGGGLIAVLALVVWYKLHRSITRGESFDLLASEEPRVRDDHQSLEQFVAAYRRGEVTLKGEAPAAPPPTTAAAAPSSPTPRGSFLSGAVKLAYLVCKSGLRDHHVFAQVRIEALCAGGATDPALAGAGVDLLICNAELAPVAAIDVNRADGGLADTIKTDYLRALGVRYLRLSAKSLPRPEELRAMLYRM